MIYVIYNTITKEILYQNYYNLNKKYAKEIAAWYAMDWGIDSVRLVGIRGYNNIGSYDKRMMEKKVDWIEERVGKNENVFNISFGGE